MKYIKIFTFFLISASPLFFASKIREYKLFNEGKKYFLEKEYDKAAEIFASLPGEKSKYNENISLYMAGKESAEGKEVEELVNKANELYRGKKYEEAKEEYWKALLMSNEESIVRNYERSFVMVEEEKKAKKEDQKKDEQKKEDKKKDENKMQNKENKDGNNNKEEQKNSQQNNENNKDANKDKSASKDEESNKQNSENMKNESSHSSKEDEGKKESAGSSSEENKEENKQGTKGEASSEENENAEKAGGQGVGMEEDSEEELEKGEIASYLEMLSGLEKQDLKNNYRPLRKGGNNEKTKNW